MQLNPIVEKLLLARGIGEAEREAFFDPSLKRLVPGECLPGVARAVDVIMPFVRDRSRIVVFGDYDCDGVSAAAILVTALRKLGAAADAVIPDRFAEGYGLGEAAIARIFREHPDLALLITVDNGITASAEVAAIRERGVKVVVTDHHLPSGPIPEADAMVEPRLEGMSFPECENLCGAGVAFLLAAALTQRARAEGLYDGPNFSGPLLVMAGVATVADLMPLTGQNRILVAQALRLFHARPPNGAPVGLAELLERSERSLQELTARSFSFTLAPRLNAAGRMRSARDSFDLLMAEDREEARRLAQLVDTCNVERKLKEQEMVEQVRARVGSEYSGLGAVVAYDEDWHQGVAGIVASRMVDETGVPAAIAAGGHGSVRAGRGYDVHEALMASAPALERFGGHAAAGGFSLRPGAFEEFRRLFSEACRRQREANREAIERAERPEPDLWVEPQDLTMDLLREIKTMGPFGEGNPEPVLGLRGVMLADSKPIGADGRHASFAFVNRRIPRAVWWGHGADAEILRLHSNSPYDALFALFESDYNSPVPYLELRIVDLRASGT